MSPPLTLIPLSKNPEPPHEALAEGVRAVTVDGKMIHVPVVERARLLLDREAAIAAREAKMRETAS